MRGVESEAGLGLEVGSDVKSGVGVVDVLTAGELESCIFSCDGSFCVLQATKPPIIKERHNTDVIDFLIYTPVEQTISTFLSANLTFSYSHECFTVFVLNLLRMI